MRTVFFGTLLLVIVGLGYCVTIGVLHR